MKIIGMGKKESYEHTLLIEITQLELEKLLGVYYAKAIPGIDKAVSKLIAGDEIDVLLMHSMTSDLVVVSKKMLATMESFKQAQGSMLKFTEVILSNMDEEE